MVSKFIRCIFFFSYCYCSSSSICTSLLVVLPFLFTCRCSIKQLQINICNNNIPTDKIRRYSTEMKHMVKWLMKKCPKERPTCSEILKHPSTEQWIEKLQTAGKNVAMTPLAERKGQEFTKLDTIKVVTNSTGNHIIILQSTLFVLNNNMAYSDCLFLGSEALHARRKRAPAPQDVSAELR